jgi:hypothetical protein
MAAMKVRFHRGASGAGLTPHPVAADTLNAHLSKDLAVEENPSFALREDVRYGNSIQ